MDKKKYIELEAAVENLKRKSLMMFNSYYKGYTNAIKDLADIPTADVQEVVKCKNCKYITADTLDRKVVYFCTQNAFAKRRVRLDDFCSYGERKDGDNNG